MELTDGKTMKSKCQCLLLLLTTLTVFAVAPAISQKTEAQRLRRLASIMEVILTERMSADAAPVFFAYHPVSHTFPNHIKAKPVIFLEPEVIKKRELGDRFEYFTILDFKLGRNSAYVSLRERSSWTGGHEEHTFNYRCRMKSAKWNCTVGWKEITIGRT